MTTHIQFIGMGVSESLSKRIVTKMEKLGKKYPWLISAEVFIKEGNDSKGPNDICEVKLSAPGPYLFAKAKEYNFDLAMSRAMKEAEVLCEKRKYKFTKH